MSDLTRALIDDTVPPGPAWEAEEDKDLDLLREGRADNYEIVQDFLAILSDLRNPNTTSILSDLEREYGIPTNTLLTEATRRARLAELVYSRSSDGSEDDLQAALRNVGFDVYVYQNDPAVDPAIFLEQQFQMVAAGGNAYAGRSDAFAGKTGGELLVNGDIFTTSREFTSVAGTMFAGDGSSAGEYDRLLIEKKVYDVPDESALWPFVFFVGGAVTRGFVDLVVNGGFETGDFTGWTQNSSTIDNTNPATGTWCSKLVASGASQLEGAASADYSVNESRTYIVKAKNDITIYSAGFYRNLLQFKDSDGILISSSVLLNAFAITVGYEQIEKTVGPFGSGADITFPSGTVSISISSHWSGSSTGTAFMDDVEFYRSDKQSITAIDNANVDGSREDEFKRIILQYKPLHSWAALIVTFS